MAQGIYDLLQETLKLTTNLNKKLCCNELPVTTTTTTTLEPTTTTTTTTIPTYYTFTLTDCNDALPNTLYSLSSSPGIGDIFYSSISPTLIPALNNYYCVDTNTISCYIVSGGNGVITNINQFCL